MITRCYHETISTLITILICLAILTPEVDRKVNDRCDRLRNRISAPRASTGGQPLCMYYVNFRDAFLTCTCTHFILTLRGIWSISIDHYILIPKNRSTRSSVSLRPRRALLTILPPSIFQQSE